MVRWRPCLVAAFVVLAVALWVLVRTTHDSDSTGDDRLSSRSMWLKLHPPRQARHDAELLRRRILSLLVELGPAELQQHVPQIVASLEHGDQQVRQLALSMVRRLDPSALTNHATALADLLGSGVDDDDVRLYALQTLTSLGDMPTVAANGALIFDCLAAKEPAVRLATVSLLALLEPEDLAPYTLAAADAVVQRRDVTLAKGMISAWGWKLESEACRARAGEQACGGVLQALGKLS